MATSPLLVGLPFSPYVHHTVSSLARSVDRTSIVVIDCLDFENRF